MLWRCNHHVRQTLGGTTSNCWSCWESCPIYTLLWPSTSPCCCSRMPESRHCARVFWHMSAIEWLLGKTYSKSGAKPIVRLMEHRWRGHFKTANTIVENYKTVISTLDFFAVGSSVDLSVTAIGLKRLLSQEKFAFLRYRHTRSSCHIKASWQDAPVQRVPQLSMTTKLSVKLFIAFTT